jgi:ribosome recycling factor
MTNPEVEKLIKESEVKMLAAVDSVKKQLTTMRTGRAHPSLVEGLKVDYYGTSTPLKQLANITCPEPKQLIIHPWDRTALEAIEKAITDSDLGMTPTNDGKSIRLTMPSLTKERREELMKVLNKVAEEGRISIRNTRHAANEKGQKLEKDKVYTEDEKFLAKDKIQESTDKHIKQIDEALKAKEDEISK